MKEIITNFILQRFDQKNPDFLRGSWFKVDDVGLVLVTALQINSSVTKGLKLKVRKF